MSESALSISPVRIIAVIARRELLRFTRQPARIAGALGTPILLWIFLASGFADSLRSENVGHLSYAAFLLPGMMSLTAVFAAILASMSVIEDRQAGWLQAAIVSPAPRWSIALGQMLGSAAVAFVQAGILMFAIPLVGLAPGIINIILALIALFFTSLAMSALGLLFAWRVDSSAGYHAVMNLLFMPMWLLSGAFIPVNGAAAWFATIVKLNPLAWCTEAIRTPLAGHADVTALLLACAFAFTSVFITVFDVARSSRHLVRA